VELLHVCREKINQALFFAAVFFLLFGETFVEQGAKKVNELIKYINARDKA
jgi:hypothetical protein